jgi:hypothetical protein
MLFSSAIAGELVHSSQFSVFSLQFKPVITSRGALLRRRRFSEGGRYKRFPNLQNCELKTEN